MPYATISQLKSLLPHALSLVSMKSWEKMQEDEIFSLQPLNSPLLTVSVMGQGGQYTAIAFYVGEEGRAGFLNLHSGELIDPEKILPVIMSLHQIHLVITNRASLEPSQIKRLTAAGYLISGRKSIPLFETMRQGSLSGDLDAEDVPLLEKALPEVIAVLNRALDLEIDLEPSEDIFVREEISPGVWKDRFQKLTAHDFHPDHSFQIRSNPEFLENSALSQEVWEVIYAPMPGAIKRPGGGVNLIQVMLVCDAASGFVIKVEIFSAAPQPSQAAQKIHEVLENHCRNDRILPAEIRVKDPLLGSVLQTFCQQAGIVCTLQDNLPLAEEAHDSIVKHLAPKNPGRKKSSRKKQS